MENKYQSIFCESETVACPHCGGNGYLELHAQGPERCVLCRGRGTVQIKTSLAKQLATANQRIVELELSLKQSEIKDRTPCGHVGCLNHLSHPCEGRGRIEGKSKK